MNKHSAMSGPAIVNETVFCSLMGVQTQAIKTELGKCCYRKSRGGSEHTVGTLKN